MGQKGGAAAACIVSLIEAASSEIRFGAAGGGCGLGGEGAPACGSDIFLVSGEYFLSFRDEPDRSGGHTTGMALFNNKNQNN